MFSKSTQYALRAVVYLTKRSSKDEKFGIRKIASDLGFPEPYLAKVLQHLVRKKIISSVRGPNGGFYASEKAYDISLLEIIEANEGLDFFNRCGLGLVDCDDKHPCPIHFQYEPVKASYKKILSEKCIRDIIDDLDAGLAFLKFV
ncbi:MAG: Rrf2 family transcriptional regulator [Chlorobi bacterium]|nr:Rrf2 family transcriptional regulator [Chlorobiota bacterium]